MFDISFNITKRKEKKTVLTTDYRYESRNRLTVLVREHQLSPVCLVVPFWLAVKEELEIRIL